MAAQQLKDTTAADDQREAVLAVLDTSNRRLFNLRDIVACNAATKEMVEEKRGKILFALQQVYPQYAHDETFTSLPAEMVRATFDLYDDVFFGGAIMGEWVRACVRVFFYVPSLCSRHGVPPASAALLRDH